jgi:hypothetical protein
MGAVVVLEVKEASLCYFVRFLSLCLCLPMRRVVRRDLEETEEVEVVGEVVLVQVSSITVLMASERTVWQI